MIFNVRHNGSLSLDSKDLGAASWNFRNEVESMVSANQTHSTFDKWLRVDPSGEIHITGEIDLSIVQETIRRQSFSSLDDRNTSGRTSQSDTPQKRSLSSLFKK